MATSLRTVLIVDDDPGMRDMLTLALRLAKFDVLSAATPADALTAVQHRPEISLVLADIVLPDMSGYDLADDILTLRPAMRMVFMSGALADPLRRAVSAPCLAKPFTVQQLLIAVDEAMRDAP